MTTKHIVNYNIDKICKLIYEIGIIMYYEEMKRFWALILGDLLSFWVTLILIIYFRFGGSLFIESFKDHLLPFSILCGTWILCFYVFGLYDLFSIKPTLAKLKQFGLALLSSFFIGILLFYFVSLFGISPKTNLVFQVLGFGIFSFLWRRKFYTIFSTQLVRPVIIYGENIFLENIKKVINSNPQFGLKLLSSTDDKEKVIQEAKNLENLVLIFDEKNSRLEKKDLANLYKNKVEIVSIVEAYEKYLFKIPVDYISENWVFENIKIKKYTLYNFANKILNIVIPIMVLIVTFPIVLLSAFFIYINDRENIFFIAKRVGLNGKSFDFYKLRSMIINAEKNGAVWADKNDKRVTTIGKIIRKTHIDEIPQMINILKGDMNLIGPRPERPEFVEKLEKEISYYNLRHIIKPGFTGWAQIKYRYASSVEDSKEKFEYDFYYTKNKNIFLDLGIIIKTIQIIFTH